MIRFTLIALLAITALQAKTIDCYVNKSKACVEAAANKLPASPAAYLALRNRIGKTPQGGATLFIYALMQRQFNQDLSYKLLVLARHEGALSKSGSKLNYKGYSLPRSDFYLLRQADKYPHCIRSYARGSSPANNYTLNKGSVGLNFRNQTRYVGDIKKGKYKVFVCSTGTSTCRPLSLVRNKKGFWKVKEFSSVVVGCRKPTKSDSSHDAADDL